MDSNHDKVIQSLLAPKTPFRLILPVFHYKAECVAPLSSFYWPSALPKARCCFATKLKDTGTVLNRIRRTLKEQPREVSG